jgi:hypothetical protein
LISPLGGKQKSLGLFSPSTRLANGDVTKFIQLSQLSLIHFTNREFWSYSIVLFQVGEKAA